MSAFIEIEVEPVDRYGKYRAYHNGEVIAESRDCFSDAARYLVAAGANMDATLVMYGRGNPAPRLYGRLGYVAGHKVSGTRVVPWLDNALEDAD